MDDWACWISIRSTINHCFKFDKIVPTDAFHLLVGFLTLGAFMNALFVLYFTQNNKISIMIDIIFTYVFVLELVMKIIGVGPENFTHDNWNNVDVSLMTLSVAASIADPTQKYASLLKIFRVYRSSTLLRRLFQNRITFSKMIIYKKLRNLFGTIVIILPLLTRFIPLFLIVYYCLGVIGMEIFINSSTNIAPDPNFGYYDTFSNFRGFIYTQFYFVQILTEAGWSSVALDYASR